MLFLFLYGDGLMGLNYNNMADTTNATYDGGIDVPHECLSGAKISINPETSKHFSIFFFRWHKKQRGAGLHLVPYVLSYYKNSIS